MKSIESTDSQWLVCVLEVFGCSRSDLRRELHNNQHNESSRVIKPENMAEIRQIKTRRAYIIYIICIALQLSETGQQYNE